MSSLLTNSRSPSSSSTPQRQLHLHEQQQQSAHLALPSNRPSRTAVDSSGNVLLPTSPSLVDTSASSPSAASTSFRADRPATNGYGIGRSSSPSYATSSHLRSPDDSIEMDPITPGGHRRRRSTLTGSSNAPPIASRTTRPRGSSIMGGPSEAAPKISEEANSGEFARQDHRANLDSDGSLSDEDLHDDEETGLTKKDKRRKKAKKQRNTRLDQRVARENLSDEQKHLADLNVARRLAINLVLIGLWYIFSLSISLYNKWMFDSSRLNFPFPLFTTSMHMLVQFSLAAIVLYFFPSLRPNNGHRESDLGRSRHEAEPDRPAMTKSFYLTRIAPCGAATGLDIGLGNMSLKFITLTFYTMCKSSSLAFVLIFAFVFRLESPTWKLVAIIATMTGGVIMMVAGEVQFDLTGFVLIISAAFFSGFRWALTQILLLRNPATSNPFSSIFFLAPVMFVALLVIALPVEGFFAFVEAAQGLSQEWGAIKAPLILLFPGTIAFLMTASEFALLKRSSVVTLSIAGIFKEVVTILVAAVVFDDKLTPINISGLVVTIFAIACYNWIKLSRMRNEAQAEATGKTSGSGYQTAASSEEEDKDDSDSDDEDVGLLAHEENRQLDSSMITLDGDIIPSPPNRGHSRTPSQLQPGSGDERRGGYQSDHLRDD
ncbi:triose-phosphate transporter family-domain-containing protein [Microdochium trichocladiopsis]|uniref:Triose-phosphate transporter family-domain-containing protein n=1 Tax=Microdochium trichocladiopsis TaxID=1682393 RepID=A0A9P8Y9C6_9PEZI|nr:triose-phosphate transporter family-domain-containing protein [Microdochium trichocladiopsis]KAH7031341.1 triose-phosphate transporter family-domain-containing protein [Microdochium trichocladiopsis]